ncbi:hypothetical protein BJ508DRAFT_414046 [Ascobolus immersus RN42]|uniref:Mediator of RNA polymerase II transcription subunit 20 n=1 Tax=Ascobolus immersus RN42 TaxID=1160509 RepID=A0A3N4I988_ASCIM|nr:hypothetical protein BJ508DRAFT_414046 [Ascobolus immersus RN42]
MQQLELSYVRGKMFVLTTNIAAGNQQGEMVLVQREFAEIARLKLNALWMQQQFVRAEGVGMEFEAWRVRVGGLMMQNTNRGLFIEVEYFSTDYLSAGAPIIREILRTFVPETLQQLNIPADKGRFYGDPLGTEGEREFTLMDTGRQYMEMLRLRPRDDGSARRL